MHYIRASYKLLISWAPANYDIIFTIIIYICEMSNNSSKTKNKMVYDTTTKRALETLENSATEKPNCDRKYEIVFGNKRLLKFLWTALDNEVQTVHGWSKPTYTIGQ